MQKRGIKEECGQAALEFALVLPVFLFILFAIIEFGWVAFQTMSFSRGVNNARWDITAETLNDTDPLTDELSTKTYSGGDVGDLIAGAVKDSSLWAFQEGNLSVVNAKAILSNKKSEFKVPGIEEGEQAEAATITRYMELQADLSYRVYPITGLGSWFFGSDGLELHRSIDCRRVIGSQHRSG